MKKPIYFGLLLLIFAFRIHAQNPTMSFPPDYVSAGPLPIPGYAPLSSGHSTNSNGDNFADFGHVVIPDQNSNPLFYVVDGFVRDKNFNGIGQMIYHDQVTVNTSGCSVLGGHVNVSAFAGTLVLPDPNDCKKYYILGAGVMGLPNTSNCSSTSSALYGFWGDHANFKTFWGADPQSFYPFFSVLDLANPNTSNSSVQGNLVSVSKPNFSIGGCPGSGIPPACTPLPNAIQTAFPIGDIIYSSSTPQTPPAKGKGIYYAASDVISGSPSFRWVFISDGVNVFQLKFTGSSSGVLSPLTLFSQAPLPNALAVGQNGTIDLRAEMELVKNSAGDFQLAVPYVRNGTGTEYAIFVATMTGSAPDISTATSFVSSFTNVSTTSNPAIHGLEFSASGADLFITHETTTTFPNPVEKLNISSQVRTAVAGAPSAVGKSQVEISTTGDLIFATSSSLVSLSGGTTWNTSFASISYALTNSSAPGSFVLPTGIPNVDQTFLVPQQVDGMNYLTYQIPPNNPTCCYFYTNFTVKGTFIFPTGTPITVTPGTSVTGTLNGSTATIIFPAVSNIDGTLIIPDNSNVTFRNVTLKFTPTSTVKVLQAPSAPTCGNANPPGNNGGRLTMDNSIFTIYNSCETGKMWPGVVVLGYGATYPFCNQGTFANSPVAWMEMINNSKIEHAITAVKLGTNAATGGGVLQTGNSIFENNQIDVDILPCSNIPANKSYFKTTVFQNTAALLDPGKNPITHVKSTDAIGINFYGCTLQNLNVPYYWASDGIQSNNSTIRISPTISTTFKNMRYGIWAQATPLSRTIYCNNAKFIYNQTGAYLSVVDFATFYNNTFSVLDNNSAGNALSGPLPYGVGLYLDNCTAFAVQGNTFQNNSVTPAVNSSYNYTFGSIVRNSDLRNISFGGANNVYGDNVIFKNTFKNINWGCQAIDLNNANTTCQVPNNMGLHYYCNTFQSVIKDVEIGVSSGAIDYHQGYHTPSTVMGKSEGFAADNSFSKANSNPSPNEFLHANTSITPANGCNGLFGVEYLWSNYTGNPVVNPAPGYYSLPVTPVAVQIDDNTCGPNPYHLVINNPYTDLPSDINSFVSQINTLKSKIDCGNTTNLLNIVAANGNPADTRDQLQNCAPYLSDNVLISYLTNPTYPDGHKQQILTACSPLSSVVNNVVKNSTMSRGTKNVVAGKQTGVSPMMILNDQIAMLTSEAKWAYDEIVRSYLNDTITPGALDSALTWIKKVSGSAAYDGRKVRLALDMNDSATAVSVLQQMINNEGANSSNVQVHDALIKLHGKDKTIALQTTDIATYNTLQNVYADMSTPDARLLAQSLLSYVDNIQPTPKYELIPLNSGNRSAATEENAPTEESKFMHCFPNPYSSEFNVKVNVPDNAGSAQLVITNLLGEQVGRYDLNIGNNDIKLRNLKTGSSAIFISLVVDGTRTETIKMIKE